LTETCGPTTLGFPDEMCMIGTVGPVGVYNELRLEEVPEMGYDPLGEPPCGEVCVRGKTVFAAYHKNPELTTESIKDGWFHTGWAESFLVKLIILQKIVVWFFHSLASSGDIGEILPNGVVKIIDRKKNLIKLSQGEYVALEYLENVYGISPIVEDVSILSSSDWLHKKFIYSHLVLCWWVYNGYLKIFPLLWRSGSMGAA
jgi:long-chain acyl-CoA synthetase